jgi:hypothetical protein
MMKSVWADRSVAALALKSRAGQQKKKRVQGRTKSAGTIFFDGNSGQGMGRAEKKERWKTTLKAAPVKN